MRDATKKVYDALIASGAECCTAKGGGFFVKGEGYITMAQARKRTGIAAEPRNFRPVISAYGDWAIVAKMNRVA